ncbi:MAG: type II secretion system protein N [Candidatus Hydrogenedens sp.]
MVHSLEIKRLFFLIHIILIFSILIALGVFFFIIYTYNPAQKIAKKTGIAGEEEGTVQNELINIDAKSLFNKITQSGLFGNAGRWTEDTVPKKEEKTEQLSPQDTLEDTQLNLKLIGTIALSPKDRFASAFIENSDKRITAAFAIGQEVVEQVVLEEVYPKEVILLNKKTHPPKRERLKLEDKSLELLKAKEEKPPSKTDSKPAKTNEPEKKQVDLNRDEIVQDFFASYADLVTRVKPELYKDAEGKVLGITAKNISEIPIAVKLGFKEGDVLTAVNDDIIDSDEKVIDLIKKYSDVTLPSVKVSILRNGNPMEIIYRIQD